jgi:hypothetical protein
MNGVISKNQKTFKCLDLSTICPNKAAGNPCPYCYVEASRKHGFHAKIEYDRIPYTGELLRLRQDTKDKINECGGLRLFSFGDYMPWMDEDLMRIIKDAKATEIKLKAITKQPSFVDKFHEFFDVINVSIDSIGHGMNWNIADILRAKFSNVFIRAAVLSHADLHLLDWVDIMTLNHGVNGFHRFTRAEKQDIFAMYPNKMCCVSNKCSSCLIKCRGIK